MNKEEYLKRLSDKFQPLISEAERKEFEAFREKEALVKEFELEKQKIEEYFYALDNFNRMQELVNNPPILIQ